MLRRRERWSWSDSAAERVKNREFLGVHIANDLTWSLHTTSAANKAQQLLHFLLRLKKANLPLPILTTFYRSTVESVLTV